MKRFSKFLALSALLSPLSTFASTLHYIDNKGNLYCQAICKVDGSEHKAGIYPKNSQGNALKVRGKWVSEGWTITGGGKYEVKADVFLNAQTRCDNMRNQLFREDPIRGLLETGDVSGVTEKSCKIYPRITSDLGGLTFQMIAEEETDL